MKGRTSLGTIYWLMKTWTDEEPPEVRKYDENSQTDGECAPTVARNQ